MDFPDELGDFLSADFGLDEDVGVFFEELGGDFVGVGIEDEFVEEDGVNFFLFVFGLVVDADEGGIDSGADSWIGMEEYRGKWTQTYF